MGELIFYFDRCFGKRFPEALKKSNPPFRVEYQNNVKFPQDMPDDQWLEIAGTNNWIVFSHDRKFHTEKSEAIAVKHFGVACFYLCGANSSSWEKLCYFIAAYPKIIKIAKEENKPYVFNIEKSGSVKKVLLK